MANHVTCDNSKLLFWSNKLLLLRSAGYSALFIVMNSECNCNHSKCGGAEVFTEAKDVSIYPNQLEV